jgi:hypothetical protein
MMLLKQLSEYGYKAVAWNVICNAKQITHVVSLYRLVYFSRKISRR